MLAVLIEPAGLAADDVDPLGLAYVPKQATLVLGLRPAQIVTNPQAGPLLDALLKEDGLSPEFGISPEQVVELTCIWLLSPDPNTLRTSAAAPLIVIRTAPGVSVDAIGRRFAPRAEPVRFADQRLFASRYGGRSYMLPNARTIVAAQKETLVQQAIMAGPAGSPPASIEEAWQTVSRDEAALAVNMSYLAGLLQQEKPPLALAAVRPLLEKTTAAGLGLRMGADVELHGLAQSLNEPDAASIRDTLRAVRTFGQNSLSAIRHQAILDFAEQGDFVRRLADLTGQLAEHAQLDIEGPQVLAYASGDVEQAVGVLTALVPVVTRERTRGRRMSDLHNLGEIVAAMYSYQNLHGHFPPAVVRDGDGRPLYSWRVELLPMLDQQALFDAFHRDEPWDSPHNKSLIAKMPAVYRSSLSPANTSTSDYFALTGPHTAFADEAGAKVEAFVDGTSNTMMVVEAVREIAWTQPEDIPYDPDRPIPEFGGRYQGYFMAAFADGHVSHMNQSIDEATLRLLITRDDGQPIPRF